MEKKASIRQTIEEILELHERLLESMQLAIPFSFGAQQTLFRPWDPDFKINRLQKGQSMANPVLTASLAKAFDVTVNISR